MLFIWKYTASNTIGSFLLPVSTFDTNLLDPTNGTSKAMIASDSYVGLFSN
jgi:hypothetical protein